MNVLDHYVTKIIKNVHQKKVCGDLWYTVKVESDCYGKTTTGTLLFETEGEAKQVKSRICISSVNYEKAQITVFPELHHGQDRLLQAIRKRTAC